MSKEELDNKIKGLKEAFNVSYDTNLMEFQNVFKDNFNPNIIKVGDKATYYLKSVFYMSPEIKRRFKGDPVQPITITYIRQDVIFFTWDKHPEFGEEYTMYSADWSKWLYPAEIKLSELWKKKSYLKETDYDEWYIQTHTFEFKSEHTKIINDL